MEFLPSIIAAALAAFAAISLVMRREVFHAIVLLFFCTHFLLQKWAPLSEAVGRFEGFGLIVLLVSVTVRSMRRNELARQAHENAKSTASGAVTNR